MSNSFRGLRALRVEQIADLWAVQYVAPAFAGDVHAARSLAYALSNEKRGAVAVAMWRAKVPSAAYSAFLQEVWLHDHDELLKAASSRRTLHYMFRYAALPRPADDETLRVWRGASDLTADEARKGFSWTIDRDIACWFATRFGQQPIVITAEVCGRAIGWLTNEIGEQEALILQPPRKARIDGDAADWQRAAQRHSERIKPGLDDLALAASAVVRARSHAEKPAPQRS